MWFPGVREIPWLWCGKILGIDDSELTNGGIVGTGHIDRKKGATLNLSTIDPAKRLKKKEKKILIVVNQKFVTFVAYI